jgi:hypothetical protein
MKSGKQTILSLSTLFLFIISIQGQQINRNTKIEIDIGLTDFNSLFQYKGMSGNYQLSAFYRISNSFSLGFQGAYAGLKWYNFAAGGKEMVGEHVISFNLAGKVYITSLLSMKDDRKIHVFVKGKAGALTYIPVAEQYLIEGTYFDYGAYLGIEYTPIRRVGLFLELGYGKNNFSVFGILFRF